nr:galectin-4-like [Misgurnus anguillicaudatus]
MNLFAFIQKWSTSLFATQLRGFLRWSPSTIQSELLLPIQNPALPYVGPISGGLRAGTALYIKGVAGTTGDRFSVNFKTGQGDNDDIAFHFNPRYNSDVVMNTFRNGGWEAAEELGPDNPFKMGEAFEIFFVFKPEGYLVYVNGREYFLFKHRIPLEKVSVLNIDGDVVVNLAGFIQNWYSFGFLRWGISTIQSEFLLPVQNPSIPYVSKIPEGLKAGLALYFHGVAGTTGDRFSINFKTGRSDKDDIAFHFNPRYNSIVALNSFKNGGWEAEESVPDNPFKMGQAFEMFIVIKPEGYQVYVNGKEYYLFKHRIPLEKVSVINIEGYVTMNLFAFIQNWDRSSFCMKLKVLVRSASSNIFSQLLHPVKNPKMPYVGPIPGGVKPGMCFYLQGTVPSNAAGFSINFSAGQGENDDIAFHFNPRLNAKVVLNTFRKKWETEEHAPTNPFKKGQAFDLYIFFTPHGYMVHMNGQELCTYKHRMPLDKVNTLSIKADITVGICGFLMGMEGGFMSFSTVKQTQPIMVGGCISGSTQHSHQVMGGACLPPLTTHHGSFPHPHGHPHGHGHGRGHGLGHHKK